MPVIALTGATGFVGRDLAGALARKFPDAELRLLVRQPDRRPPASLPDRGHIIAGDLDQSETLQRLVAGADVVVHVAAAIAGNSAADFERTNVVGTRRLLDAVAAKAGRAHFILVSSLAARRPVLSWYAASKRAAEERVAACHPAHTIVRPPAVYGPQDPALADFWRWLARGYLLRLGPAGARFSLLHIDDLVDALLGLIRSGPAERILTLAGPQPDGGWTWPALSERAAAVRGGAVRTIAVPAALLRASASASLAAHRVLRRPALLSPGKVRELQHHDWVCDNQAMNEFLGWRPSRTLDAALPKLPGWTDR